MTTYCTRCSTKFDDADRFCAQCGAARPDDAAPAKDAPGVAPNPPTKPWNPSLAIGLGVLAPLGIGALIFALASAFGETLHGQVSVTEGPRTPFTFRPTGCVSMQPYGRFGANLHAEGPNDGGLYVTVDPTAGKKVEIEIPGSCRDADGTDCTVFPVPRDRCTVFDAAVHGTGTVVNDVRLVEGHVRLDCTLEDGTRVVGNITFDGC